MEIKEITYKNKIAIEEDPDYPEENQVTDENMNEIKEVVNYNGKKLKEVSEIELQTLQEENKKLKSALINVETEEAKSLHIEDASEVPAQLKVMGNQEQKTREGYNLLNSSLFDLSEVSDLATFNQKDGTITFNGTFDADINIRSLRKQIIAGTGKENILIKIISGSLNGTLRLVAQDTNYGNIKHAQIGTSSFTSKLIENVEYNIFSITITSGTVMNNLKLGFMIVNDSDLNKEYEQYGAMPSPDYPSEVVCLGSNKNEIGLQEIQETTTNGITYKVENEKIYLSGVSTMPSFIDISLKEEINLNNKKVFRAILENIIENNNKVSLWLSNNENENLVGNLWLTTLDNVLKTTELDKTATKIRIYVGEADITFNTEIKTKLEKGEIQTAYSPHNQGSTKISKINNLSNFSTLANGLSSGTYYGLTFEMLNKFSCKITGKPNSNELRFGNSCNSKEILIPFEKGKHYKVKNSFNSASEITLVNLKENSFRLVYVTNKSEIQIQEGDDGISSVRLYPDTNTTYNNEIVTCLIYTQEDDDFIPGQTDYILNIQQEMSSGDYFVKEEDGWKEVHNWTKIDSYNSESITTDYISTTGELTTGATIYYKLATPTKLPCTEEQSAVLDEIDNLDLFEGVNNIITAENIAKLKLKYVADTKTYVDNQVNERLSNIENQIINLSGGN